MSGGKYISEELKNQILAEADLRNTIEYCVTLEKKRTQWIAECGACSSPDGLRWVKSKDLYKCVKCKDGGKYPVQYLQQQRGMTFHEALLFLAEKLNISVPDAKQPQKLSKKEKRMTFRDRQLKSSAVPEEAQRYSVTAGTETRTFNRYEAGRLVDGRIDSNGDDMILVYRDENGQQLHYRDKRGKEKPFYRVRYKFPDRHISPETGKPTKYKSPPGSKSELWLTEYLIRQFSVGATIKTLYIPEGEKKADVLGAFKRLSAGIMGIHNLSTDSMPYVFERLLRKFKIENVVLLFDLDWQELSLKDLGKSVNIRPKIFCSAARKFKDFFYAYVRSGEFNLKIYIGTHKSVHDDKGLDDMLFRHNAETKATVMDQLDEAVTSQSHENDYWKLYDVTSYSDHKFKELWDLHSDKAFLTRHEEQLKGLTEFKLGNLNRRWNESESEFELADELLPTEKYWNEKHDKHGDLCGFSFDYIRVVDFFRNRGIGIYETESKSEFLVHVEEDNMVKRVSDRYVQRYMIDFTLGMNIFGAIDIARFIKAGINTYLGSSQIMLLDKLNLNFVPTAHNKQILVTKSGILEISQDDVKLKKSINYNFFESQVVNREFSLTKPLFKAEPEGNGWKLEITELGQKSEFIQYLYNTSCTYWRSTKEVKFTKDNREEISYSNAIKYADKASEEDRQSTYSYFITKMLAIGYLIHDYEDESLTKAIICNDLKESSRGEANGRTGKSIYAKMFKYLLKFFYIDGGKRDLMHGSGSRFLFEGVDDETKVILFDDVKDDFDFQALFSKITYGLKAESKSIKSEEVGLKKYIITLNGFIRKQDDSARARQYHLGFTDYYNLERTPRDHFGHNLFSEWDKEQWNLWMNFMIQSCQLFLKYKLSYEIPAKQLKRRNQILTIGENLMEFLDLKYDEGYWTNLEINKNAIYQEYIKENPQDKRYTTMRSLKKKFRMYADFKGMEYNARNKQKDIKSNGKEYLCISNEEYSPETRKFDTLSEIETYKQPQFQRFK